MSSSGSGSKTEFQVGGKYRLVRKIGSGSFGDIYLGVNITNGEVCIIPNVPYSAQIKQSEYVLVHLAIFCSIKNCAIKTTLYRAYGSVRQDQCGVLCEECDVVEGYGVCSVFMFPLPSYTLTLRYMHVHTTTVHVACSMFVLCHIDVGISC